MVFGAWGLAVQPAAAEDPHVQADVRISGRQLNAFDDAGEQVAVILDDFEMVIGDRRVTARDAVVWISSRQAGQATLHDIIIIVYAEGDARLIEPWGGETGDPMMYLVFHVNGSVTTTGTGSTSQEAMTDFPLYRRGQAARRDAGQSMTTDAADAPTPLSPHPPPELLLTDQPPASPMPTAD
ncbi:MAG: hypothetical protein ACYTFO_08795, partial [Planctomycetota bacterium]